MYHQISNNHILFKSEAFCKDALAFNLMTTILENTECYPDTKCFSNEKNCIFVNTDAQHPIIVWTSDDFQDFEKLYQFIQTEFSQNKPFSLICKQQLFDFYKEKNIGPITHIETIGVYQYDTDLPLQYNGFADNIQSTETEKLAEMIYQFYHESKADVGKSRQDCIQVAQKFITNPNYKIWRNTEGKIVAFARYRTSNSINRIGMVYTRPEERGKSYAKMIVHYLTQKIRQEKKIPILYTDFNYLPSNKCYTAIGYKLTNKIFSFTIQK